MKRALLCVFFAVSVADGVCGKTFFLFKPSFLFNDPERRALLERYGHKGILQATVFGGQTDNTEYLASYFLPVERACIRVTEDGSPNAHGADVNAMFLNVVSVPLRDKNNNRLEAQLDQMTYDSSVRFCPKRTELGVGFVGRCKFSHDCWLQAATSVVQVRHKLGICEQIFNTGGSGPDAGYGYASLCAAIQAGCPAWNYGKFYSGYCKKNGVPEVELSLGHDCCLGEHGTAGGFIGAEIPTGSAPCQRYLFAPQIGNGRHVGLFTGSFGNYIFWAGEQKTVTLTMSWLARYLFERCEQRSFDLKGKPWSRYMLVWRNRNALADPNIAANVTAAWQRLDWLVNYSTLNVSVAPGWSVDLDSNVQFERNKWTCALGYHAYARQEEDICFCNAQITGDIGLQAFSRYLREWASAEPLPVTCSLNGVNSPMIGASPDLADYTYVSSGLSNWRATYIPITVDRLDRASAQVPATLVQTLYVALGYQCDTRVPLKIILGASYTGANDNNMPTNWKAWGTLALAF